MIISQGLFAALMFAAGFTTCLVIVGVIVAATMKKVVSDAMRAKSG